MDESMDREMVEAVRRFVDREVIPMVSSSASTRSMLNKLIFVTRRPRDRAFHGYKLWNLFEQSFGWIVPGFVFAALTGLIK